MKKSELRKIIKETVAEQMMGMGPLPSLGGNALMGKYDASKIDVSPVQGRPNVSQATHPGHSMEEVLAFIDRGGLGGGRPGGQSRNKWQDFKHMLKSANPFVEHDVENCPMH